jgi:hypothetical protein
MDNLDLQEIYRRLGAVFPPEAIERTKSAQTRRGYDTCGLKYQYIVNRMNEVLGLGGFRVKRRYNLRERQSKNGNTVFEASCDIVMQLGRWVDSRFVVFAEAMGTGGHASNNEADAKKGSFTNGFKKVAAMFGCGWQAYAGTLDDDNGPLESEACDRLYVPAGFEEFHPPLNKNDTRGRITQAQLDKLHELVDELEDGDWNGFRAKIRKSKGFSIEYANRQQASELITTLLAAVRQQRSNGNLRKVAS